MLGHLYARSLSLLLLLCESCQQDAEQLLRRDEDTVNSIDIGRRQDSGCDVVSKFETACKAVNNPKLCPGTEVILSLRVENRERP